jgi:CRISPR/Cas system type I-B associated protein Csh2 (Cas7 group RAMP superfamily)
MMSVAVACKVIWNKRETNPMAVLRKAAKYLSAELGDISKCEVETGTKSKIRIKEEQFTT